ncbi:hypothetical protein V4S35_09400 [Enterococcus cecorum]
MNEKRINHDAIRSMLHSEQVDLRMIAKETGIDFKALANIQEKGSLGALTIQQYLILDDYAEIFFQNGRKFLPPICIAEDMKGMSIFLLCEYIDGFEVRVDYGQHVSIKKVMDRKTYAQFMDSVDLYFECFDEPDVQRESLKQIKQILKIEKE